MIFDLFDRVIRLIVRAVGGMTVIHLALLVFTMYSLASGLVVVIGKLSAGPLNTIAYIAILVGWLLARTRLNWWKAGALATAIGLVYLLLTIGRMGSPVGDLLTAFRPLPRDFLQCTIWPSLQPILPCEVPDLRPLVTAWKDVVATLTTLFSRLAGWYNGIRLGIRIVDPLVAPLFWAIILWQVVTWATWWVRRRNSVLVGLLPAVVLLAYNIYYTNDVRGIFWLVLVTGGMLLVQAANSYSKSERHWVSRRMDRVVIEPMLAISVILLVGSLMLAGGLLPSVSIQRISTSIQKFLNPGEDKNLAESLGLQQTPNPVKKTDDAPQGPVTIATVHAVGAGQHLTQDIIMYIQVEGYNPLPPEVARVTNSPEPDVRYYWRAQTYESYNGHVWITNNNQTLPFEANQPFHPNLVELPTNFQQVTQHVQREFQEGGIVFAAGELLSADQPSITEWRTGGELVDAQTEAARYTAISRIQYVTISQLRQAGNEYPDSIRNRYLSLPDILPQRVRDLALDLTADQLTTYDRAIAIQTYLRQFPYSLDVPAPPTNRDVADYFLFDLQTGYCDYFATTMVVLSRAAGLPARLVTGYASGNYDYDGSQFVVVAANSHAWVEIYFPGLGWVEFEPTTNLSAIPRPGEQDEPANALADLPARKPDKGGFNFSIDWDKVRQPLKTAGTILGVLIFLLWVLPIETWLLYLRPSHKAMETIYTRLYRRGRVWGIQYDAARTPSEFTRLLSRRLEPFSGEGKLGRRVTTAITDLGWLTGEYNRLLFGPAPLTPQEHRQVVNVWSRIRRVLLRLQRW